MLMNNNTETYFEKFCSFSRDEDDANDDPDYQQPASVSQKDDDMDDEDDKVTFVVVDMFLCHSQ